MLHVDFVQVKTSEDMGKAAADEFEAVIHGAWWISTPTRL